MSETPKPRKVTATWGPCKHGVEATMHTVYGFDFYGNAVFEETGIVNCEQCKAEISEKIELGIPSGPVITKVHIPDYSDSAWDRGSE